MKIYPVATALILSLAAPPILAQQEPRQPPTATPDQSVQAQSPGDTSPPLSLMQQRLEEMQAFMEKLNQTTDPAERQKLVQEHRQKMQELGGMMRNLRGGPMGGMHGMHGMMDRSGKSGERSCMMKESHHHHEHMMMAMMAAYQQMDKRLDLIQDMLEKLLEEREEEH